MQTTTDKEIDKDEEMLKSCVFFVEATSNEVHEIWNRYHEQTNWEEIRWGFARIIGQVNCEKPQPVNVSFNFAKIYGQPICFYNAISRFVDHTIVEDYIKENYPVMYDNGHRRAMTDAQNFHHAVHCCQDLAEKLKTTTENPVPRNKSEENTRKYETGLIILKKLFDLPAGELKAKLLSVCGEKVSNKELFSETAIVKKITENDTPDKIEIWYHDHISINAFGITYTTENGYKTPVASFNEHFKL